MTQENSIKPRIFVMIFFRGNVDRITVQEFSLKVFLQSFSWEK